MQWTLYYDGGCNLCHAAKLRVERWAEAAGQPLHVDILQGPEASSKGYGMGSMVLEVDGKALYGGDAWLEMMRVSPWYLRWLSWLRFTGFTRWLVRVGYGFVARVRFRVFGRRACPLPPVKPGGSQAS